MRMLFGCPECNKDFVAEIDTSLVFRKQEGQEVIDDLDDRWQSIDCPFCKFYIASLILGE